MDEMQKPTPAEMYERYFGPAIFIPWTGVLLEHAAPQPGERVLDLACGTGIVARHVAPVVGAEGEVVGLDVSPDMLAVAGAHPAPAGAAIEWREGDATAPALPDGAFDLVLCQQGLQFFADRTAAAREMRRVLGDGGRVVLNVWQPLDRHPVYEAVLEAEARHLDVSVAEVSTPFTFGGAGELRALLDGAGFRRIEVRPKTLDVRFPAPERFVELTVLAGAAVVPEFAQEDPAERAALVDAVTRESAPIIERYRDGDTVSFPMTAHIAVAYG